MPKAEVGTPKWISNQWKKKGLNKLRWYCGLCKVSCRDANGFALHLAHENHLRREAEEAAKGSVRDTESRYYADDVSEAFERAFLRHLVRDKLGQRVRAHEAYRAINPDDRQHAVMKSTCWGTLGRFIADLRDRGEVEAWRDDDGWIVTVLEGFPCCAWAMLPDDEAKRMHSRMDSQEAPVGWRDVGRLPGQKGAKQEEQDDAFARAQRVAASAEDDSAEDGRGDLLPEKRSAVHMGSFAIKKGSAAKRRRAENVSSWLRPSLIVKAKAGKSFENGLFDKVKCRVVAVTEKGARLERLDKSDVAAEVDQSQIETVLPAIGKRVRVVEGEHNGEVATLVALDVERFCVKVRISRLDAELEMPYEHVCKDGQLS